MKRAALFLSLIAIILSATAVYGATVLSPKQIGNGSPTIGKILIATSSTQSVWGNIVAGSNISVTTSTPGQITIASTAGALSGTANYVPYYTATTTLSSTSTIYMDGTNIGLGTTAPRVKLDVVGTASSSALTVNGTATTTNLVIGSLNGLLKGTSGSVGTASNGTDFTLITAASCSAGEHVSAIAANGTVTCSADTGSGGGSTTTINNVVGPTFTFSTGTSGSDFAIATSSGTVTFNIPDASGSNRGLLTSANWTTFNNKQAALTFPLAVNQGGTGATTTSQYYFFAGPSSGAGAPTFRAIVAADIPTLNQNTTGSAAKWTTARTLAGNSVDGSANVAFSNKYIVQGTSDAGLSGAQFLGSLATGILKNTATTGVLSIAAAGDFPTLNQNTTGSAASLTTARAINGVNFDGTGAITVPVNNADDTSTNATMYPLWSATAGGNYAAKVSTTKLTFNPSNGVLSATTFSGAGTSLTGTASALSVGTSTYATTAGSATSATSALTSTTSTYATTAGTATSATSALTASTSTYATTAGTSTIALGLSGTLAAASGGTGTGAPTITGQVLMASSTDWVVGKVVAGAGITVTTSTPGTMTIANSAAGMTLLYSTSTVANATTFTTPSFASYENLSIRYYVPSMVGGNDRLAIQFNGDTGSNYAWETNEGGTASSGTSAARCVMQGVDTNQTLWGVAEVANFSGQVHQLAHNGHRGNSVPGGGGWQVGGCLHNSSTTISTMTFYTINGNSMATSTQIRVYGW